MAETVLRELKATLMEESKERASLEQQKKALQAEVQELKTQLSQLRTESSASKLALQAKNSDLLAKVDSMAKEMSMLDVQDRKNKKSIAELKKQVGDLMDIKKRHQVQQTEIADKLDTENKERTTLTNEIRKLKEELKDTKLKMEAEQNGRNKAEMELDNLQRRIASQDQDFKSKQLASVKEFTALNEVKKKLEQQLAQVQKRASEIEIENKALKVKLKDLEKKLNQIYRQNTVPKTNTNALPPKSAKGGKRDRSKLKEISEYDEAEHPAFALDTLNEDAPLAEANGAGSSNIHSSLDTDEIPDILLIGKDKLVEQIITFLNQKKYKATNVDPLDASDLLSRKRFQCVGCPSKILPEILSANGSNFLEVFKKNNSGVPFFTFTLSEGIDSVMKQLNHTNSDNWSIHELVKCQITVFLQNIWATDQIKKLTENFEKEKEVLTVTKHDTAIIKLEEELRKEQTQRKKVENENTELNKVVRKLMADKSAKDNELQEANKKVSALCSRLFLLELEKDTSVNIGDLGLDQTARQDQALTAAITSFETPIQSLTRLIILLLKDDRNAEIRPYLESMLRSLSQLNVYNPDFEHLFKMTGLDTVTQSWMLYEFSKGQIVAKGHHPIATPEVLVSYEEPMQLADVEDKSVVEQWNCNPHIFTHDELITLYIYMLEKLGVVEYFNIPTKNLVSFCRTLARSYRRNPYHNFHHAVDVAQMCFKIVYKTKAMDYLTELDLLALMVSAICHDVDHPGLNNNFQINDNTHLALLYNDISVLENHHASRSFYILNTPENNIFGNMEESKYRELRRIIISAILATDMVNHFELMSKFTSYINTDTFSPKKAESRQLLVNVILHIADIANVARPWDLARIWADKVLEEFLHQGDLEKEKDLLISPYMDRNNTDQPKMTLGFIDYMVQPMFLSLKKVIPDVGECLEQLMKNRAKWVELSENEVNVEQVLEEYSKEHNLSVNERDMVLEDTLPEREVSRPPSSSEAASRPSTQRENGITKRKGNGTTLDPKKKTVGREDSTIQLEPVKLKKQPSVTVSKSTNSAQKKKGGLPVISKS